MVVTAGRGQISLAGARDQATRPDGQRSRGGRGRLRGIGRRRVSRRQRRVAVADACPPASDLTGSLRVGAGELRICAPPGLGLRVTSRGVAGGVVVNGLDQAGSDWQSPDYASATHRADLTVRATFGAVEINPIGGCS